MSKAIQSEMLEKVRSITDPIFSTYQFYRVEAIDGEMEIRVQRGDDPLKKALVLRMFIVDEHKQIHIPNIYMPEEQRQKGYGKAIISAIFEVGLRHGYDTFVVDLVQSFYRRLVNRGAVSIDDETVQITSETRLIG